MGARASYARDKAARLQPVRDDRFAADNQQERARREQAADPRPRLVLVGDSRIQQWRDHPLPGDWRLIHRGIGGDTTVALRERFEDDVVSLAPDVVVIQAGINDLVAASLMGARGVEVARATTRHLQELAARAAAAGSQVMLLTVIPPARPPLVRRPVWSDRVYGYVDDVNRALQAWAPPAGVRVVDAAQPLVVRSRVSAEFAADTLHLNARGYDQLNRLLQPVLEAQTLRPRAPASEQLAQSEPGA